MKTQEFTAKTVDDALTEASLALGLPSTELNYEIVTEGSKGLFGLGSKDAVIRVLGDEDVKARASEKKPPVEEKKPEKKGADKPEKSEKKAEEQKIEASKAEKDDPKREKKVPLTEEEKQRNEEIVKNFLSDVFRTMELDVSISIETEEDNIGVELSGDEMGVLIGKRGQTLDSLQYLTNLAVNRKSSHYVRVKIDTEDYRSRRKETLENLAKNVAFKVKRNKKPVELEPMNPFERRIIHSALQDDRFVTTYSEGEEPHRHVVVALKR